MAERSIDAWLKIHPYAANAKKCETQHIALTGSQFGNKKEFLQRMIDACGQIPYSVSAIEQLFGKYGSETEKIVNLAYEIYNENRAVEQPLKEAELVYSIQEEHTVKPEDFYIRRTGMLYFDRIHVEETHRLLASSWEKKAGYDTITVQKFESDFQKAFSGVLHFE